MCGGVKGDSGAPALRIGGGSLWHLLRFLHHPNLYHSCCQNDRCLTLTKPVSEHQLSNMLSR
jgi:hypothetical protein